MKVSIVTISYNQSRFLEQTICSVLEQDYPNIEYIVVDAGSMDGSRKIIDKYRNLIGKVIFEPDRGPADGLNKGFSFASGDILGYINSDDYYLPQAVSKIVLYFQNHPTTDVVSGNAQVVDAENNILRRTYSDRYSLLSQAYGYSILIQPSSFFRAKTFRQTQGFNVNNFSSWDDELVADMALNNANFGRINETISAYRVYETNITGSGILGDKIEGYANRRFLKITGRKSVQIDRIFQLLFRLRRYITNPRDILERIMFGPVYARFSHYQKVKKK